MQTWEWVEMYLTRCECNPSPSRVSGLWDKDVINMALPAPSPIPYVGAPLNLPPGRRPVGLCSLQFGGMELDVLLPWMEGVGFDRIELGCNGVHFDVDLALGRGSGKYCDGLAKQLETYHLSSISVAAHTFGLCVCQDPIEDDYAAWVGPQVWGNGDRKTMWKRAQKRLIQTAIAAKRFGVKYVKAFFGSRIYRRLMTDFPPTPPEWVERQWEIMVPRMRTVLDAFGELGVFLALEAHKGENAWNVETMIELHRWLGNHPYFTYNWDSSHLKGQGVSAPAAIRALPRENLIHVCHWKGAILVPGGTRSVLSPLRMGDLDRGWNYINVADDSFERREEVQALNEYGLPPDSEESIEHEDNAMDNCTGAVMAYKATRERHSFTAPAGSYEDQMK